MPGSVANASVSTVLPQWLARSFVRADEWRVDQNVYQNGEVQSRTQVTAQRLRWTAEPILTADELEDLKDFWLATLHGAFYYYDPYEAAGAIGSNYDGTGSATTGRHKVRWEGAWQQTMNLGRFTVRLGLVEVA
jgi:hypothetical protein